MCKTSTRKNSPLQKAYCAVFLCCSIKAIHCELVSNLANAAFIAVFKRMISRRRKISNLYSDNGTNFVDSNRELKVLDQQHKADYNEIVNAFAQDGFNWHFIPPNSIHFGGLWQAAVKSVKGHLKKIAGQPSLTFEELYISLTMIETILKSRPITPLSAGIFDS